MTRNRRDHHLTGCPQMVRYRQRKGRMVMFADDGEPGRPNAWPARPAVEENAFTTSWILADPVTGNFVMAGFLG